MNKQEQRITIAEACGWKPREAGTSKVWTRSWLSPRVGDQNLYHLPDYLSDLNAMREAEKVLTAKQWDEYGGQLECTPYAIQNWIHATAAHRAEAFLKTLNLWE